MGSGCSTGLPAPDAPAAGCSCLGYAGGGGRNCGGGVVVVVVLVVVCGGGGGAGTTGVTGLRGCRGCFGGPHDKSERKNLVITGRVDISMLSLHKKP